MFLGLVRRARPKLKQSVRFASAHSEWEFKTNFNPDQQAKILNKLNELNREELSRYNLSQARIKSLEMWKSKKGPFRSLNEVLEVDGLGVKVLEKICENIVADKVTDVKVKAKNLSARKNRQFLSPNLQNHILQTLSSAVGIHIGPIGISWAQLSRNQNQLLTWNYIETSNLPIKLLPVESFNLAMELLNHIPKSDIYIFEGSTNVSPQSKSSTAVSSYNQQLEIATMLLALLNTSKNHNVTIPDGVQGIPVESRVYYLRSKLPARLFKTLLGNEKVSALPKISNLLEGNLDGSLPCSKITLESNLKSFYNSQSAPNQELLGQALMLIVTFMDLCVYSNPISLSALNPTRRS